jgi:UDP-N-acetylglucosamine 2-epimerase (non-hydrolysing)
MLIDLIAGARPNFIKISSIINAIRREQNKGSDIHFRLVHTGQHYDKNMSDSFFEQLNIPIPDINLGAGGGTQAEQTASIMIGYEKILLEKKPLICLVVGDVTSTMACSITAQKMGVKVAHVEAGIRSYDWTMPEEINRLVTDSITNYFFTTTKLASDNLRINGINEQNIYFVGNTMIDSLITNRAHFIKPKLWDEYELKKNSYLVLTLHRPSNVDNLELLNSILLEIINNCNNLPIIFPVHPRTLKNINKLYLKFENLHLVDPMTYLEFNFLVENSLTVITDSGGITEETTFMGIPCITLRDNTERPETITIGTNELIGTNPAAIKPTLKKLFNNEWKKGTIPELWDGCAGDRIINTLLSLKNIL